MIFIGEDTQENENPIQVHLKNADFDTRTFKNASDVFDALKNGHLPTLFILNKNFLKSNGTDFIKITREEYNSTAPVIIISEDGNEDEIIKWLTLGADDFLAEPFSPQILVAHVKAQIRRTELSSATAEKCIRFGEFTLLLNSNVLKKGETKIPLSAKEYGVLEFMVKKAGETLSPSQIYENVWKTKFGDITAVAVYMQRLRKKIESDPANPVYIKTIFGQGYSFSKDSIKN
ncbi:MAG: response regulator transcription factor [Treponema sp.]|jgi:two-component system response regulator RegX3|nr:response regulator transcription factor [Treponema sp.]